MRKFFQLPKHKISIWVSKKFSSSEELQWARIAEEDEDEDEVDQKGFEEVDENKKKTEGEELYCIMCGKKFKSEKQWKNHEQLKKHHDKVDKFGDSIEDEDIVEVEGGEEKIAKELEEKRDEREIKRKINEDDEDSMCSDMEDLALFTKKYKKFMKFKKNFEKKPHRGNDSKERKSKDDPPICFECKKPGHMKMDCPMRKKNKYKGREMLADWLNSDEKDSAMRRRMK
ncbi:J protein JJJ1-like [Humulus lupulus]|uniref:J protein JJJ1-like n=1 Tax=Humulus lupulus TaxID=3486 RepID=UPI002B41260B|nr:J protein JJJ1-like [Humulus lupulus]